MSEPSAVDGMPQFAFDPTAVIIYGGGGHVKTLIELVRAMGVYRVAGIVDDHLPAGSQILGAPVLGGANALPEIHRSGVRLAVNSVGGIGNYRVRLAVFHTLAEAGFVCPAVVHPSAHVEPSAVLEAGVQVLPKTYVGSDVRIGCGSLLNSGVILSHDCTLGVCTNVSPGAMLAGGVQLEDFVQVGMGVTINLNLTIGRAARIGNGATVKMDVPAETIVRAGTIWPLRPAA